MLQLLAVLRRIHWNKLVPMLPLAIGFAACDLCGYGTRPDGTDRCATFALVSYQGMPYGPVTIKWKPTDSVGSYTVGVYNATVGWLGFTRVSWTESSAVVTLDAALVKKVMDADRRFEIVGMAGFNAPAGGCQFQYPIYIPKNTPVPASSVPGQPPPQPPQPPQQPAPTHVPTLPPPVFVLPTATRMVPR